MIHTSRLNLVGHPHAETIDWATVRFIIDGGTPLSPQEAEDANYVGKTFYVWNGNAYDSFDDDTPAMEGVLTAYDGIWVEVKEGAIGKTVEILMPFGAEGGAPPPPPG